MADIVVIRDPQNIVVVQDDDQNVVVASPGPAGPTGPQGPTGAAGGHYSHIQTPASTAWFVDHMLGFRPNIAVLVNDIDVSDGVEVTHIDENHAVVASGIAISGRAECS
jgi:hypothetical protein